MRLKQQKSHEIEETRSDQAHIEDHLLSPEWTQNSYKFVRRSSFAKSAKNQSQEDEVERLKRKAHESFMQVRQIQELHQEEIEQLNEEHHNELEELRQQLQSEREANKELSQSLEIFKKNSQNNFLDLEMENCSFIEASSREAGNESVVVSFKEILDAQQLSEDNRLGSLKKQLLSKLQLMQSEQFEKKPQLYEEIVQLIEALFEWLGSLEKHAANSLENERKLQTKNSELEQNLRRLRVISQKNIGSQRQLNKKLEGVSQQNRLLCKRIKELELKGFERQRESRLRPVKETSQANFKSQQYYPQKESLDKQEDSFDLGLMLREAKKEQQPQYKRPRLLVSSREFKDVRLKSQGSGQQQDEQLNEKTNCKSIRSSGKNSNAPNGQGKGLF